MIILVTSDFEQILATSSETLSLLQSYIDKHETKYIRRILGEQLGNLFIADLINGVPQSARFVKIFNKIDEQPDGECERFISSDGMKEILKGFVFYHYISETQAKHSQGGVVVLNAETANVLTPEQAANYAEQKFSESLSWAQSIQMYCGWVNEKDYPEYSGVYIRPKFANLI